MFGIGMPEMLMILAIALIVIGPKKLPDLAKSLGRALGEFKRAASDLKDSIQSETGLDDVRSSFKSVSQELKKSVEVDAEDSKAEAEADAEAAKEPVPEDPLASVKKAFDGLNQTAGAVEEGSAESAAAEEQPQPQPGKQPPKPQETPPE